MKILSYFIIFILVTSCAPFELPEFISYEGFKMGKMDAKQVSFSFNVKLKNPNSYALKVKKSSLSLSIDAGKIGILNLEKTIKLPRKKETIVEIPMNLSLEKGALMRMLTFSMQDSIRLNLEGDVRGGSLFFSKKFPLSFSKSISPKALNLFNKND
jgi:LEA14-like dessication related protein